MEYLFEMHTHTKEVSTCAVAYAEDLIESYRNSDYKGIVMTNHLNASTFERAGFQGQISPCGSPVKFIISKPCGAIFLK